MMLDGNKQKKEELKVKYYGMLVQLDELSIEKVAKYSGLTIEEVEELAKLQTV